MRLTRQRRMRLPPASITPSAARGASQRMTARAHAHPTGNLCSLAQGPEANALSCGTALVEAGCAFFLRRHRPQITSLDRRTLAVIHAPHSFLLTWHVIDHSGPASPFLMACLGGGPPRAHSTTCARYDTVRSGPFKLRERSNRPAVKQLRWTATRQFL